MSSTRGMKDRRKIEEAGLLLNGNCQRRIRHAGSSSIRRDNAKVLMRDYLMKRARANEKRARLALIFAVLLLRIAMADPTDGYARSETLIARRQTRGYSMEEI